jgi:hypothetical protein
MNNLPMRKYFLVILVFFLVAGSGNAQLFHKNPEKQLFGKTHMNKKEAKIKEPGSVTRAKRKQERNQRKLDKQYDKSVRQSQKRTVEIQSPEVQARMKQNKKDLTARDKEKKKKIRNGTKRAGKKYN